MADLSRKVLSALTLILLVAAIGQAQSPKDVYPDRPNGKGHVAGTLPEGVGTVAYDPGAPADVIAVTATSVNLYGNLFNSRNGGPLSPGTVSRVSWYTGSLGGFAPVWFALPGGAATYLGCCSAGAASAFNSALLSLSVPSSFFLGFDVGGTGAFASLGLRSATTNGQGFHGRQRYYSAGASNVLSGQNAMVRVSGSLIVPVELIEFEVE